MKKRALGRGLSALLESTPPKLAADQQPVAQGHPVIWVSPSLIQFNRNQPRKTVDSEALEELASSIKEKGIIQPLVVRRHPEKASEYELIAGERRLRASRLAALETVPVILWEASDEETLELALIENVQREDLNPLEEAAAYAQLQERFSLTQEQVAQKVGKRRSTVANSLRLLELRPEEQRRLLAGELTAGHARALLSIANPIRRTELLKKILAEGLSVRQAEALAQAQPKEQGDRKKNQADANLSPEMYGVQEALRDALGTKVVLQPKRGKGGQERPGGKILIEYYNDDDIERILERLGAALE